MNPRNTAILGTHLQCIKRRKEGKPSGKKNPPSKYNAKVKKRKLLGNRVLHPETISQESKLILSESLGGDINSLIGTRKVLNINDPIMNEFSNEVHVDLDMFELMPLHWITSKI